MALPHQLISHAFVRERDEVVVGHLADVFADLAMVRALDGQEWQRSLVEPEALAETLHRSDVTHHDGAPIVLFHPGRGLLAVLTGPAEAPAQLELVAAVDLESDVPTVVLGADEDQAWLVFETNAAGEQ